jgi:hypothetical protein
MSAALSCPNPECEDTAVVQHERAPGFCVWVLDGWLGEDGLDVEIDFCPWCGVRLEVDP